jgi:large subunit ribosomal protein L6
VLCLLKFKEMSRIGKLPITIPTNVTVKTVIDKDNTKTEVIPAGVSVKVDENNIITVKGRLGELKQAVHPAIEIKVENGEITVNRPNDEKQNKANHGLYRALVANMVKGVSEGFKTEQEFVGVGYKAEINGQILEMSLGYSHSIMFQLPPEITAECKNDKRSNSILIMKCIDKQLLGQVAAKIRSLRPPEPYKGKGIKFVNEVLRRKAGKSAKV